MWEEVRDITGGKLLVIGGGPLRASLAARAVSGVEFLGFVSESEKHDLVSRAWLLLHASSWEGWGLVINEASVRGTPCLGFDAPGVRDAVIHGETGLLAGDAEEFKRLWIRLSEDAVLRHDLAARGLKRCAALTWSTTVEVFQRVAHEAIMRYHCHDR
jgi:glycosyltransferase involved in cell wall biosynthesis